MSLTYRIISIGTLSHNRLWGETQALRTAHATTSLVAVEDRLILVDPSLPAGALGARFNERTGKRPEAVTDVFLTNLRPTHRRGLDAFPNARVYASEVEIETYGRRLAELADSADRLSPEDAKDLAAEQEVVRRVQPAPDKLHEQVHLYPLPGASPGGAGLLLTPATATVLIAGDAALTIEHVQAGQVWEGSFDTEAAMDSLQDILQVADVIVPGHDNLLYPRHVWL